MKKTVLAAIVTAAWFALDVVTAFAGTAKTTDILRVRKAPSLDAEIIDVLPNGAVVDAAEKYDNKWTKIRYKGQTAYVAAEYLKVTDEAVTQTQTQAQDPDSVSVPLNRNWKYADFSEICSGSATMYHAKSNRKGKVIGINAGHGTGGGNSVKTYCHPDKTAKVTGGTTASGAVKAVAVSSGMTFNDGTSEAKVNLKEALILKDILLSKGYDVLMIRESDDVQLDNVARTVICNNMADCHIAIHWDGDGLSYDKGCFYMSVPDGIKYLDNVAAVWQSSEKLGDCLISGLSDKGCRIMGGGSMDMDLTQTSFSTIPTVDIELGNQSSVHDNAALNNAAAGLAAGIDKYFGF